MSEKILIIEDELPILSILRELLTDAGYEVYTASNGVDGLAEYRRREFDLVLLDIMMPRLDGYAVCKTIRETSQTPVIMLTALDDEEAQIKAFELQADDYITKPFSLKLVLLRIEAVLRRSCPAQQSGHEQTVFTYKEIRLETENMRVYQQRKEVFLTRIEFELLKLFLANQDRVFTRDHLLNHVWGYDFVGDEKTVNIHIMNLRRKLGFDCIETIRGVGYRLAKN